MTYTVCWEAIAGVQVSTHDTSDKAYEQIRVLIFLAGHGNVYLHDAIEAQWSHHSKGIRGRVNDCDIPENEVPKPYRLFVLLGD